MSEPSPNLPTTSSAAPSPESNRRKPFVSLAIATAFGLGYLPKAPGTFGSLAGLVLALFPFWFAYLGVLLSGGMDLHVSFRADPFVYAQCWLAVGLALTGLWSAHRAAIYWNIKDPQRVVID